LGIGSVVSAFADGTIVWFDLALGVALLAAIAYAATCSEPRGRRAGKLGWSLIAIPLPLVVVLQLTATLPTLLDQTIFVVAVVSFAVGALLVLGEDEDPPDWSEERPDSPPWWPDFERDFREYTDRRVPV